MAKKYNVKSGSRRWPLQIFFNILDLAGINTFGTSNSKKEFMFQLADELATENVKLGMESRRARRNFK